MAADVADSRQRSHGRLDRREVNVVVFVRVKRRGLRMSAGSQCIVAYSDKR